MSTSGKLTQKYPKSAQVTHKFLLTSRDIISMFDCIKFQKYYWLLLTGLLSLLTYFLDCMLTCLLTFLWTCLNRKSNCLVMNYSWPPQVTSSCPKTLAIHLFSTNCTWSISNLQYACPDGVRLLYPLPLQATPYRQKWPTRLSSTSYPPTMVNIKQHIYFPRGMWQ